MVRLLPKRSFVVNLTGADDYFTRYLAPVGQSRELTFLGFDSANSERDLGRSIKSVKADLQELYDSLGNDSTLFFDPEEGQLSKLWFHLSARFGSPQKLLRDRGILLLLDTFRTKSLVGFERATRRTFPQGLPGSAIVMYNTILQDYGGRVRGIQSAVNHAHMIMDDPSLLTYDIVPARSPRSYGRARVFSFFQGGTSEL